jgi:hypothetical protein
MSVLPRASSQAAAGQRLLLPSSSLAPPSPHWFSRASNMQISRTPGGLPPTNGSTLPAASGPECSATSCCQRSRHHLKLQESMSSSEEPTTTIRQSPSHHQSLCRCLPPPQAVGATVSSRSLLLHWFLNLLFIHPRSTRSSDSCLPPPLRQLVDEAKSVAAKISVEPAMIGDQINFLDVLMKIAVQILSSCSPFHQKTCQTNCSSFH